jgi:hypothetical protein
MMKTTTSNDVTIVYNYQRGQPLPPERWASAAMPTLAVVGGKSPDWMRYAMSELAGIHPNAKHRTVEGQTHIVKPEALAPVLVEFFEG